MQFFKAVVVWGSFLFLNIVAPVLTAQEVAISGKDFESGAGDAKLAEIARQAAATGKTIVVSTPPYWQDKAVAKLRAGSSSVHLRTSDAFFENVLVRIVGNEPAAKPPVEPPKPPAEPAPKTADAVRPSKPAEIKPAEVKAAEVKPVPAPVVAKAQPAKVEPPRPAVAAAPSPAPAAQAPARQTAPEPVASAPSPPSIAKVEATPASAAPVVAAPPPAAASIPASAPANNRPAAPSMAESRERLEAQLGVGKNIDGSIKVEQLQKGDQIFVRGPARAVVRRSGAHTQLFWLEGALNLERAEISKGDAGRYRVDEPIRKVADPTLHALHSAPRIFAAQIPAEKSSIRSDMERHFNDSKQIAERLRPDQLQYGDLFYMYRKFAVVFRRTDAGFERYWLEGAVDLNQAGVVKDGDAYRVVSDRL